MRLSAGGGDWIRIIRRVQRPMEGKTDPLASGKRMYVEAVVGE